MEFKGNKSTIKAVILNDTSSANNHGCKIVVEQIYNYCFKHGIDIIQSVKINEDWQAPIHLEKIKSSDIVIVNGEGTMHHSKEKALRLASVAKFSRDNGIIPFLINSVYQDNDGAIDDYARMFELVFVRESNSQSELAKIGIQASVVPDMVFSYPLSHSKTSIRDGILFTDSVLKEITNKLYCFAIDTKNARFATLQAFEESWKVGNDLSYKTTPNKIKGIVKTLAVRVLGKKAPRNWYYKTKKERRPDWQLDAKKASDFVVSHSKREDLMEAVNKSELIVTGRFHMVCFALMHRTPFVALSSNTFKIEGLLQDVGLSHRIVDDNAISKEMFHYSQWRNDELAKVDAYIGKAEEKIDKMFVKIKELADAKLHFNLKK